jgi:hypothetical protein
VTGGTSRRVLLEAILGLGAGVALYGSMDASAWTAYEAVEEAWIRDRYELLVEQAPAAAEAARIDLELKLADLRRRGIQFRVLLGRDPGILRGGVWQMTSLPVSDRENAEMMGTNPEYRASCERMRRMSAALRSHRDYDSLRRAQIRLWKTPQYRDVHRRYTGRMQELQLQYGSGSAADSAVTGGSR